MEKAVAYNNAGVTFLEAGNPKAAWELFKGALEVKLAREKTLDFSETRPYESGSFAMRAEKRLSELEDLLVDPSSEGCAIPQRCRRKIEKVDCVYRPHIYARPFRIEEEFYRRNNPEDSQLSSRKASATIIFNLALLDHVCSLSPREAISLYELASSLIVGQSMDALGVALMNNIGIWCFEHGDFNASQRCMEHMSQVIRCVNRFIDEEDCEGVVHNMLWILSPPTTASPAA